MSAARYDLEIPRGADFNFSLCIQDPFDAPVDLFGSTFKAEIREAHRKPLAVALTVDKIDDGTIRVSLTKEQTLALNTHKKLKWDLFWADAVGKNTKLLFGDVSVDPNITNITP